MTNSTALTNAQIASFEDKGFLLLDFSLDENLLDAIVENVEPLYDQEKLQQRANGTRVENAWKHVDEGRQLATDSRICAALQQLFGRKPLPFQTLNFPTGTAQFAHSDTLHFSSVPAGYMAGVWVALEDIDENNGPLLYYSGSHKLEEYSLQSFGLESGYDNYPEYEQCIQQLIKEKGLPVEYGLMKKGMALIWHANLLHGGAPQIDPARSRHSQVTHYYFEDCKYYTPMVSGDDHRKYHHPFWIPETPDYVLPENQPRLLRLFRRLMGYFK